MSGCCPGEQQTSADKRQADQNSTVPNIMRRVRTSISKMGATIVNGLRRSSDASALTKRLQVNFNNLMVKIPGCHGNSVFKFEVFDGE